MAKINLVVDTDKQALKEFYLTALTILNEIQTDADNLQTATLNTNAKVITALRKTGEATGYLRSLMTTLRKEGYRH